VPFPGARETGVVAGETCATAEPRPTQAIANAGDDEDGAEEREPTFHDDLNEASKRVITAYVEPALAQAAPEQRFQFERQGYFVADLVDHAPGRPVFNRTVTLRDSWSKPKSA
jgi:glutaminyl-tRNA synthetase